jgi:argininosuccinate synthase
MAGGVAIAFRCGAADAHAGADMSSPKKIVLAYSGGLDTSVILPWLKERYPGVRLVAFAAELGQGTELAGIERKARRSGADEVVVQDLRREFVEQYCFPMLRAHATYEGDYLLGTSIARPLIAKAQVAVAHRTGADAVAHGATGKGNDQVRFELTYMALDPSLTIVAPWKDPRFLADGLTDRETAIAYAVRHRVPISQTRDKIYSQDRNLWHISHEGGEIEDPGREPLERVYTMTRAVADTPARPEYVEIEFSRGTPVAVNGRRFGRAPHELLARLNAIAGRHGVGQVTLVENRLVGMKSRGVYETPGGTVLYEAHKALEQICLERDLYHFKQQAATRYGELVYYGQWFHPLREALQAFADRASEVVTGTARLKLFKGRASAVAVESPTSLYDTRLASFAMKDYDVTAARGFIDLFGLPIRVRGLRQGGGGTVRGRKR